MGQEGHRHISPLGAYDADTDRFLILGVSRYKAPAVWTPTERLFTSMAGPLGPGKIETRGFLLIRTDPTTIPSRHPSPPRPLEFTPFVGELWLFQRVAPGDPCPRRDDPAETNT
jgi:hypothetical protein